MLSRKITTGLIVLAVLQTIDYFAAHNSNAVINTSASWGVNLPSWLIIALLIFAFALVAYIAKNSKPHWPLAAIVLVSAGVSNVLDRIVYGGVIDYIHISSFPIFNLADITIIISAIWFGYSIIRPQLSR